MNQRNNSGFGAIWIILIITMIGLIGFGGYYVYTQRSNDETKTPQKTGENDQKVQSSKPKVSLQKFVVKDLNVSVEHDSSWSEQDTMLLKTINGRSYRLSFQKNNQEFLARGGAYANSLVNFKSINANSKPHYIAVSRNEYAYLSSCPPKVDEACSIKLNDGYLFIMLNQQVTGAQYPVELDFSRADDKQILEEATVILGTLKY